MDRSRGRARGRSRPQLETGSRPGMPQGSAWQPLPRGPGAWGGPQGGMTPQPGGQPQMQGSQPQRQPPPQGVWGQQRVKQEERPTTSHGRASSRGGDGPHESGVGKPMSTSGAITGGGGDYAGRGAARGRRVLPEKILQTRPEHLSTKKGSSGRPVKLCANFFQLLQKPSWCLYQYRVDFAPEEDQTAIRKRLMRTAVKELDLSGYIFDGTVMCAPRRLTPDPLELFVDGAVEGSPKVRITIKLVGDVAAGDYHYLQVYNLIIRKCMSYLKLQLVGRNFFDPLAKIRIPQFNMEIWPGYVTSIRQHEDAVLLSCEITHKIMRNERVYDLMLECSKDDHVGWKKIFQSKITGTIVLTDYNNKTYRIDDIDFDSSPASTFTKKDGTSISYVQYYQQRYGINIVNMQQPLLISVSKPREIRAGMSETIVLIPELCRMTGLTDQQKANFALMKALADHTRVGPEQRLQKLYQFSQRLRDNQEVMAELRQWDWELANNVVEFAGRVLPNEMMLGGGSIKYPAGRDVDWTKELRTRQMFSEVPVQYWVIVFASRLSSSVQKFAQMLKRAAQGMHWKLGDPRPYEISDDRISNYLDALNKISNDPKGPPKLILCIVSNNKSDRYAAIKKKCCVDTPLPTQVMVARNLDSKGAMSIATKVAVQMNCKIGGAPWSVVIPLSGMMVIGYDVCHDPQDKCKSYGAMVASLDKQCTRYFSTSSAHTSGEELSNDFALNIIKAVKVYQQVNNALPEKFLIYRDGVGDGQLPYVHEHEVEQIKNKLAEFYGHAVRMAFIIVSKRINTRIFGINRNSNPEPGTVADDVITLPERYDFYLVSQCTRQGTVSPTSYNIISDNFGLDADKLQIITHKLTHMYYNWSGTVRVPAPCQYAHKLAFLTSQSLKRSAHPGLSNLLYYL